MDKLTFLTQLRAKLGTIPEEDRQRSLDYYAEMIDDRMENGLSEAEAVAAIGDLEEIVRGILAETPCKMEETRKKRNLRWWEITLLVLGSPVWASLLIAVAAVIFSVWISLWSVVISLYATVVALGGAAIGCIFGSFFMLDGGMVVALGVALVCAGLTILIWMLSNLVAKGMVKLTKLLFVWIKGMFAGKEQAV